MDIGTFFQNLTSKVTDWGSYFIMFLGTVMLIWAVVLIVKGFMTHGSGRPTNWLMIGAMILVGGLLITSGFSGIKQFADIGKQTLEDLARG